MPIVTGIEAFSQAMADYANDYVLIGGGACSILFEHEGEVFRATKDLDIVVLADAATGGGFARCFWDFIKQGGYRCWKRSEGYAYYRFNLPANSPDAGRLPGQIELFARRPDFVLEEEGSEVAPLPFDEGISSLSAIILDDGYYEFIKANVSMAEGVPLLTTLHIIPLKMRAHVDLSRRHAEGLHVNQKDLVKHRSDVAKLSRLLRSDASLPLKGQMAQDAALFFEDFESYIQRQTNRKVRAELEADLAVLREVYGLA